jgi:hypothetical protein
VAEKNLQRKLVQIKYDTSIVLGQMVSVQAIEDNPSGIQERIELMKTKNDGLCEVSYPQDFTGESKIAVRGSGGGEDSAVFNVD